MWWPDLWPSALSATAGVAALIYWRMSNPSAQSPDPGQGISKYLSKPPQWAPADVLPVVHAGALLNRDCYGQLVRSILSKSGLSSANIESDLVPIIHGYASFVQLLPASEAHHHAQPGGLLQHTLEVVDYALTYRRSYMLPKGEGAERVNELKHVWTMAVILVSMFHDIGKPMSDQIITLYASDGISRQGKRWTPLAGPMASQGASHYHVAFNPERRYEHHQELPVILMQRIVPAHVLAWIGEQDPQLLNLVIESLGPGADPKSILVEITRRADQESTRVNLLNGPRTRFATARETPLIDVLDEALQRLLLSGRLRLNVPGGHGFVDGDDLLLVVPRTLDELRQYLASSLVSGSRGIPQDNLIVYSTWMDFGRLQALPSEAKPDGSSSPPKAVWRVRIEGIPTPLTVLRFSRHSQSLKGLEAHWPGPYEGLIEVVESASEVIPLTSASDQSTDSGSDSHHLKIEARASDVSNAASRSEETLSPTSSVSPVEMPSFLMDMEAHAPAPHVHQGPIFNSAALASQEDEAVQQLKTADGLVMPETSPQPVNHMMTLLNQATSLTAAPSTARSTPKKAPPPMKIKQPASTQPKSERLEQFEDWLRLGLKSGHIAYNSGQAMVHFHQTQDAQGQATTVALFITPALYQRFAKETDPALANTALPEIPRAAWLPIQTSLLKAHAHRKEQAGKIAKTIFRFATKGGGVFGANVMTDPVKIFGVAVEPNPYITGEVKDTALVPKQPA